MQVYLKIYFKIILGYHLTSYLLYYTFVTMKVEIDGLISPRKYAKRVGISHPYVYQSIYSGKLKDAYVIIDENYYVYPEKVDKILNKKPLKGYV